MDIETQTKQLFKIGTFEGPLDLLLFLIQKAEVSIYDIPIAKITEQYLQYMEFATQIDLENITEFYLTAATLLYIKSQTLLPVEIDFDDEQLDPRKELVDRLIEYQKFKKISELIDEKSKETEWIIERSKKQRLLPFTDDTGLWEQADVWDLLQTFSNLMASLSSERIIDLYEEVSVNEKLALIHELIERRREFHFADLVVGNRSPMEIVCSFLAVLESVKMKLIAVYQNRMYGDIRIRAREIPGESRDGL